MCILINFYIRTYFRFAYSFSYCLVPLGSGISVLVFPRTVASESGGGRHLECWKGGGVIQVERIYFLLFYLTCTLATSSGRNTGRRTAFLLTMGIRASGGERETSEWGGVFPLNHYHCWHQGKPSNVYRLHGHLQRTERRPDSQQVLRRGGGQTEYKTERWSCVVCILASVATSKRCREGSSCLFQHPRGCPGHEVALRTNVSFPEIGSQLFTYASNAIKGLYKLSCSSWALDWPLDLSQKAPSGGRKVLRLSGRALAQTI